MIHLGGEHNPDAQTIEAVDDVDRALHVTRTRHDNDSLDIEAPAYILYVGKVIHGAVDCACGMMGRGVIDICHDVILQRVVIDGEALCQPGRALGLADDESVEAQQAAAYEFLVSDRDDISDNKNGQKKAPPHSHHELVVFQTFGDVIVDEDREEYHNHRYKGHDKCVEQVVEPRAPESLVIISRDGIENHHHQRHNECAGHDDRVEKPPAQRYVEIVGQGYESEYVEAYPSGHRHEIVKDDVDKSLSVCRRHICYYFLSILNIPFPESLMTHDGRRGVVSSRREVQT